MAASNVTLTLSSSSEEIKGGMIWSARGRLSPPGKLEGAFMVVFILSPIK
jgi:hypothetical protein